jgi:fused signal recognition particle receptor
MFKKFMQKVDRLLGRGVIDEQLYEELEEALLQADTHIQTTTDILEELRETVRREKITQPDQMKERLKAAIADRFSQHQNVPLIRALEGPTVYLFVGVNGVGKTTSIAKLASRLRKQGHSVLLAAGDTFRAAAPEQLNIWAERLGVPIIKSQIGADSASVVYDAINSAKARSIDYVLVDTAGRQHSKQDLMRELQKIKTVLTKSLGRAADEVLLVLDSNTGQNALRQAEEFSKAAGVTGLILTKLDGTARGGALIGVYDKFKIPIKLIGTGEKIEDMQNFDSASFAQQLFV